jgi:hypothetical protein
VASEARATLAGPQSVGLVFIDTLHVYGQVYNRPRVYRPICSYRLSMCIFLRPRDKPCSPIVFACCFCYYLGLYYRCC